MRLCGRLIPLALPMGDTVGQVFADDRDAVTNGPHDGFRQPLSCSRWHVADPVTFRLLPVAGAGECRESRDREKGGRTGWACPAGRRPDVPTWPCPVGRGRRAKTKGTFIFSELSRCFGAFAGAP